MRKGFFMTAVAAGASIALAAGCNHSLHGGAASEPSGPTARTFTLFYLAEVEGTPEPCGCASDPRGGMSRVIEQIRAARARSTDPSSVLFVDAGGLLYDPDHFSPDRAPEERLKADFVVAAERAGGVAGVGLGYEDLLDGPQRLRLSRQAANVTAPAYFSRATAATTAPAKIPTQVPPQVVTAGGVKVGLFGVADPDAVGAHGVTAGDPTAAAKAAVATLRKQGAEVVVALVPLTRAAAAHLVQRVPGIDFAVVGEDLADQGLPEAEAAGNGWLLVPADRDQALGRIEVTLRGPRDPSKPLTDAGGEAVAAARIAYLGSRIAADQKQLDALQHVTDADPAYVKTKKDELAKDRAEIAAWRAHPLRVPATGPYFVDTLIPIKRSLACDPGVQAQKVAMDRAIGALNLKTPDPPVPAPPGGRHYVGVAECESCHRKEVAFWKTTVHAHAFQALVDKGKQFDRDCILCHVTGWHEPGGSSFSSYASLENVQCEVCHGPGSDHVDAEDKAEFDATIILKPDKSRCEDCHTPEQSDTFAGNVDAYFRDITSETHGKALHDQLGPGPTAHEVRTAALDKAGRAIGKNCE